ncbi:uncharacterized protein LOC119613110 [Lucilia sericata]|uniref:uncharacterized protein LOC119613110 n=1 Tax=Lucilia sericata TaxID=13632 RepID=UPI0018A8356B|nr:uncharacterized protein LOC119613110 [Lucilia sericata]
MLSIEEDIDLKLQRLWEIDEVQSGSNDLTPEQSECETFFNDTVHRESSGRIVVKLPFKESPDALGLSRNMALKRFVSQERRFARDSNLKSQYVAFMKEYEDFGHMSLVRSPRLHEPHYFIPHHCVFKPSSTSTKLRVVFDASCPSSSQKSLNDLLMVGPTIQDELYKILLRFRLHRFALTADIVKMYRQVLIDSQDRKFQYILWRNSEEEEIRTYHLNTVTYGMSAAPYLAIKSLHYLADQYMDQFELGAKTIKSSFYVDDFLCGSDTLEELSRMKQEVNEILIRGSFQLDKWHSNHRDFQDDKTVKDLNIEDSAVTSALGISWDQQKDVFLFLFSPKVQIDEKITKRTILSLSSALFDPLGLLSPLIIKAKIIMQELWILKIGWDESVPQEIHSAWKSFVSDLKLLPSLKIPRFCLAPDSKSVQLHGFCDSSIRAYGCCFYFRVKTSSGNVVVRLFTAKSRVAPTKRKSLPKLELCGAQLLAKLYSKIKNLFAIPNLEVVLWTDSQLVLHWLKQHSSTLSVFVGNRVSEIQDLTNGCVWRHVPTQFNPADIVSRGSTVQELASSIWFNGPAFLALDPVQWPPTKTDKLSEENQQVFDKEKRKTPQEIENAKLCIVFNIQKLHFQDDITRALKKKDPQGALKCLNPFLDSSNGFNLLKVGGRLEAPHFGGLWEAAVKSAKGHLTRTLDNTRLTYEELATAMIEIEAVLNSRPISPLSSDPSDFEALTPGHFLIGAPLRSLPERDVPTNEINKLEYWARISAIKQQFWKKWSHDYINELQTRNKWTSTNSNITPGSLVIIKEDNLPPQRWLMGKIINIVRGRDDRVRVVDIKTTKGVIRRPIHRLALLSS